MPTTPDDLRTWIAERGVQAEVLEYATSTHSVAEAAAAAGVTREHFVKSICMIMHDGRLVVVVVKGEDRASATRVGKLLGADRPRSATPEEMLERTGYPCGGTPPFGFEATWLVDDRVLKARIVYGGGGAENALVRLLPAELVKANGGQVVRVRS